MNTIQRRVQLENKIFIDVYKAYPATKIDRDDINLSNSIILPPSALDQLSTKGIFDEIKRAITFRILNIELNISTHCGVLEFTAEEGVCYIPSHMFEKLSLLEGQRVQIRNTVLKSGTYIKMQPHLTEFLNNANPKTIIEFNLRNYICVTEGDTISVKWGKKIYKLDIVKCAPEKAINTIGWRYLIDIAPPKDCKEPEYQESSQISDNVKSSIRFKPHDVPMTEIEKKILIQDEKFSGHHSRLDGKDIPSLQVEKILKQKLKKKKNYNPRECIIETNPRPCFKYTKI